MLCSIGRSPANRRVADRASILVSRLACFAWLSLVGASAPSYAQSAIPLTLAEAENRALEAEPGQAALEARADALDERAVADGQLPDPQLRVGLANYPIESGGFSTEGMTQAVLGIRLSARRFPFPERRANGLAGR